MRSVALRLYGKNDLRLEEFDLPPIADDEILADVTTNSICMSSHKATIQGADHKRVPGDIAEHPVLIGHEFSGTILEVGKKWREKFQPGRKYSIQPAMNYPGREMEAPGYSFRYVGGNATKVIIPKEVLEMDCLLPYEGDGFFKASLSEPVSCVIGAFHTQYHYRQGEYRHAMGIVENGLTAILAGAGPMGLCAVDYALHGPVQPRQLVVTDIDDQRLKDAASIFPPSRAKKNGVTLHYANTGSADAVEQLLALSEERGYDDVFVFAPVPALIEQASRILGVNGCLNFFAGPSKKDFFAAINFYDVHYSGHHVVGSSGGNTDDMREALDLMGRGALNPAAMITHIGGIDSAAETILNLPKLPGGKKLIYTNISLPLTPLAEFAEKGKAQPLFTELAKITKRNRGLWSVEAETYLLENAELYKP